MIGRVLRAPVEARTWREFGYVVTGAVLAVPTFVLALAGVVFCVLSLLTVGLPPLVGVLFLARGTPRYFRGPARLFLGWTWPSPPPLAARGSVATSLLRDGTAWRALAYSLVRLPLVTCAAYLGSLMVIEGSVAGTYPVWWWLAPQNRPYAGAWLVAAGGVVVLFVFPWYVRLLVALDRLLVRALLEPNTDRARIAALESSRAMLRADAAALLRRVERDLHDGTQARLVALGMALARIERRSHDAEVGAMVAEARGAVVEALEELRDIVRGIHPPVLDDGLAAAIETLAARSAVPVEVRIDLSDRPSPATETALYFTVA